MRPFRYLPKTLQILLQVNAVIFAIALLSQFLGLDLKNYILGYGAVIPAFALEAWRYVTYMFIHVDFFHFLFNMLMLWTFGAEVIEWMGEKHFLSMYFLCGIFAGIFSIPFYLTGLMQPYALIIGASGALMGVFIAYYKFFPERRILIFFIFPMKIKHAVWLFILFDILLARSNDGIAHFAHLGGVIAGFVYMHFYQNGFALSHKLKSLKKKSKKVESEVLEGEVLDFDTSVRLDEILRKVKQYGVHTLTSSEREFLIREGKKYRK